MAQKRIMRFGMAGLGSAATALLPEMKGHPNLEVTAAAELRKEALDRFASEYGGETYTSVEEMVKSPNIDAVYVATPNHLHAEHVVMAANAGKQILVEKPMALNLAEADVMIQAAERNGVRLMAGHTHSFDAPIKKMAEIIHSGQIGLPWVVNNWYYTDWMLRGRMPEEIDPARGGGVVYRQGPHQIDILRILCGGMVKSVRGKATMLDPRHRVEGGYVAYLEFENGAVATGTFSGYGYFDSHELQHGIGENGEEQPPDRHLKAHRLIQGFASAEDEWQFKDARRYGGVNQGWGTRPPGAGKYQPWYGVTVVSCERGDIRQSPEGLLLYTSRGTEEVPVPRTALEREAELNVLYEAWANDRPLEGHDGRWGKATLEVCLGILQSTKEGREIPMRHQVAYG